MSLRCGTAAVEITPERHLPLCGGLFPRPSDGTADPLMARALYLEQGEARAVLVGLDLIGLPYEIVAAALSAIEQQCGVPPQAGIVWATHTHSGPYVTQPKSEGGEISDSGPFSPLGKEAERVVDWAWIGTLSEKIAEAAQKAQAAARPASAYMGVAHVPEQAARNRRYKLRSGKAINNWLPVPEGDRIVGSAGPLDTEVVSLRLDDRDSGVPLALFYTYACHCHGRWGSKYASGFPFAVQERLAPLGHGPRCLFGQGAAADINGIKDWRGLGEDLSGAILKGQRDALKLDPLLRTAGIEMQAPLRDFSEDQTEEIERVAGRWQKGAVALFQREAQFLRAQGLREIPCGVRALRLGQFALVTSPGELFVEYGMELKARSPLPWTSVLSMANAYVGYLPTARAFEQGGYETLNCRSSRVSKEGCAQLVEAGLRLLEQIA